MELEKNEEMNILFNFYSKLLTKKQQEYMNLYYVEDLSLGEISEQYNVSRQAVFDNLKRSEEILKSYENDLKIIENMQKESKIINQLNKYVEEKYSEDSKLIEIINKLNELSDI